VAGVSLIENTLTQFPGLDQMQIVQNDFDDFLVRIVPGREFNDAVTKALTAYLRGIFGDMVRVDFKLVAEIQPEASGKYRFSICRIG
jgi:phenylacetate-CoA ligase